MNKIIQSEDTKHLTEADIIRIAEIEQDGWAHGIWEYRKCNSCWHIHSKQDIHGNLDRKTYTHTVKQIQKLLGNPRILCQLCSSETSEIFWEDYIEDIINRYKNYTSFLTTFRDDSGEIQGFLDGYISDFDTIYQNEFQNYYADIGKEKIINLIEKTLWRKIPEELFMTSSLCLHEKYKNIHIVYNLMKSFYKTIEETQWSILWIYESNIGTNIHAIHEVTWGQTIWLRDVRKRNVNKDYNSDISIHEDIWKAGRINLEKNLKTFLTINKGRMRKIIEMGTK